MVSAAFLRSLAGLGLAFVLGTAIGFERQWRQRTAGLRTAVLVAVGAAAFADFGVRLGAADGAMRLVGYVVSGIGFLGAGVILKDGTNIRGLNTAATLWCAAAVGSFAGAGLAGEAVAVTAFVLAGNTLLRPLVDWVNRRPITQGTTEAQYRIHVICAPADVADVRDLLEDVLTEARYPIREVLGLTGSTEQVELAAVLIPSSADPVELEEVVAKLEASRLVRSATWTVGTTV